jgi:uncharacterized protein YehS (DUF1456 family)
METASKKSEQKKLAVIINNRETFVEEMLLMDRKKLEKNYNLVLKQLKIAYETKNNNAYEILYEMENQILEALVLKKD